MSQPRILNSFRIDELSGVDRPAQKGARAVLMKRDFSDKERQAMADKGEALPDGSFPIANTADLDNAVHAIGRAKDPAKAKAHIIARAKALNATSQLPDGWISKTDPNHSKEDTMSAEIKKALGLADTATDAEVTTAIAKAKEDAGKLAGLEKANTLLKAKADMSPAEQAYMKDMSDGDADDFAGMSAGDRKKKMAKALEGDETFTAADGSSISKRAVGEGAFTLLKSQDAALKKVQSDLAIEKAARETAVFAKRAQDELANLSGPLDKKASLLKAIASLPDADQTFMTEVLKGADAMAKAGFAKMGVGGSAEDHDTDPSAQLDKMAKAYAFDHKVSYEKAYDAVTQTTEGAAIYKRYADQHKTAA